MHHDAQPSWARALRASADQLHGRAQWRALEELLQDPAFLADSAPEFPAGADEFPFPSGMNRRTFVKLMGASAALAGLTGCLQQPPDQIVPYVHQPPEESAGVPLHYATTMTLDGYATGLLVESHVGRPTKVEGNPEHPASLGSAGRHEQASVLGLYDPQRATRPRFPGRGTSWSDFVNVFGGGAAGGDGLHVLLEPTTSPLVAALLDRVRARHPGMRAYYHAPLAGRNDLDGARLALGQPLVAQYDFGAADVVLALDSDFLASGPFYLRYARQWADRRRLRDASDRMNRLYVAEPAVTPTGASADDRRRAPAGQIGALLAAVFAAVPADGGGASGVPLGVSPAADAAGALARFRGVHGAWAEAVARDLAASRGRSLVIVGDRQPPEVHALAHALNAALGNVGRTVWYTASPLVGGGAGEDLAALDGALRAGTVRTLVVLEGNPAYTAPADLDLVRRMQQVPNTAYLGLYDNETAQTAGWFVPAAHYLESWGDARAYDGTLSAVQPLIAPLYGGRTAAEVLAALAGEGDRSPYALLRAAWAARGVGDAAWNDALQRGVVPGSALPHIAAPAATLAAVLPRLDRLTPPAGAGRDRIEVAWAEDSSVYDGRFANNAWLQELPDPLTKLTWDNAALLSPATATRLGVDTGDVVELRRGALALRAPVFVLPGHADDAATLPLGYGRQGGEAIARGVGFDAYQLRTSDAPGFAAATIARVPGVPRYAFASTQAHWAMAGRDDQVAKHATLDGYRRDPAFAHRREGRALTLYQPPPLSQRAPQWAMTIDLTVCTGCNACVVACQAENNVPVVGKAGVQNSREMHWLRVDRYYAGDPQEPEVVFQPMLCQHCGRAPCEVVCPVYATLHSPDGLNEMVYNRCVGTRFCSNNCPYKVRRFNWFDYNDKKSETEKMAMNPRVTVRARGVMEKCTFCVQRLRRAEVNAQLDGRTERSSTWTSNVQTACQQACPTHAIIFGDQTDPASEVARLQRVDRAYDVLSDLGTAPRVRYLARVANPAPRTEGVA